ncbi:PREDICTED: uncharacterized protein LOC109154559 [Ipomoea nil]|uniref:uncharacterized protein LOC109154559 n=1 Tax=Ipomoea nil TaxID=35883 RepID=UPI000901DC52|nr:PREDICTED: uncharacterized protein LOC109154559 [Ipomoea nil]
MDMSRSMSQQQSSSSTHDQLLNDAPLEDIFPNQEHTQDNETLQEQTQDSETLQEQNEDLQSSSKKKTRTTWEAESRKHQKIAHTCGSKSFARRRVEMEIELGDSVNRSELWIDTHKVKRGSSVNEECRIISEKIINKMDQGSSSQSQSVSQDDPLRKAFGEEHPGRVRGLGFGPCPSNLFNNTSRMNEMHWSSNDNQMKEYVSNLKELAAIKAQLQAQNDMQKLMIRALVAILEKTFGKVPEQFVTLLNQTSQPVPDEGSKHQSSQGSEKQYSSSSHHVNGQSST